MVVDGLEVFRLHHVPLDALILVQHGGDVAHHVLDELGIVVGALGHQFLVRTLEQPVELARSLLLDHVDDVLDPDEAVGARRDRHMRALVVRAVGRNLLRARAQARHRHQDFHGETPLALVDIGDEGNVVVHQALDLGHRRRLVDKIGKIHLDVAGLRLELFRHLVEHALEGIDRDLALMRVEDLDEARHVRALEMMRQAHVHVEVGDGVLHAAGTLTHLDRMADGLDADLVDGEPARVLRTLHVGDD